MLPGNKKLMYKHLETVAKDIRRLGDEDDDAFAHSLNLKLIDVRVSIRSREDYSNDPPPPPTTMPPGERIDKEFSQLRRKQMSMTSMSPQTECGTDAKVIPKHIQIDQALSALANTISSLENFKDELLGTHPPPLPKEPEVQVPPPNPSLVEMLSRTPPEIMISQERVNNVINDLREGLL